MKYLKWRLRPKSEPRGNDGLELFRNMMSDDCPGKININTKLMLHKIKLKI